MKTNELSDAIKQVLPATSKKGIVAGWETIVLYDGELITFNDKICISIPFEPAQDFQCAVKADDFKNTIKSISDKEITLCQEENNLIVVSETTEAKLPLHATVDSILDMVDHVQIEPEDFEDLSQDFLTAISLCKFSVSDDFNNKNSLFALKVIDKYVYSADRLRLSKYTLSKAHDTFLLPKTVLSELIDFNPTQYKIADGWAHFTRSDTNAFFSCRLVEDNFPDCEAVIKNAKKGQAVKLPDDLRKELEASLVLYDDVINTKKFVRIKIKDGKVKCYIQNKVWMKKEIPIDDDTVNLEFVINAAFLVEILTLTNTIYVSKGMAQFRDNNFEHLIMLTEEKEE